MQMYILEHSTVKYVCMVRILTRGVKGIVNLLNQRNKVCLR